MCMVTLATKVSLAPLTTLKVGGSAAYFAAATTTDELVALHTLAKERQLPLFVLGGGSNILVADAGYAGLVLHMKLGGIRYHDEATTTVQVTCGAGESLDDVVADTTARGYWGLENLSAIPGTVGATPVQNVGAYGVEVADVLVSVTAYDRTTEAMVTLLPSDCMFGYRDSLFKRTGGARYIITAVTFLLSKVPQPRLHYAGLALHCAPTATLTPGMVREKICAIRRAKFPDWHTVGTAGSFFKNPIVPQPVADALLQQYPALPQYPASAGFVKVSLGFILDKVCGLRGYTRGAVGLYEAQALVLVATFGATAADITAFSEEIKNIVHAHTGITIECEVQSIK